MKRRSWKTTLGGVGSILTGAAMLIDMFVSGGGIDGEKLGIALTAISGGLGLIVARDNNVSSEDVGAKAPPNRSWHPMDGGRPK